MYVFVTYIYIIYLCILFQQCVHIGTSTSISVGLVHIVDISIFSCTRPQKTAMFLPLPVQETPVEWPVLDLEVGKLPGRAAMKKAMRDGVWTA